MAGLQSFLRHFRTLARDGVDQMAGAWDDRTRSSLRTLRRHRPIICQKSSSDAPTTTNLRSRRDPALIGVPFDGSCRLQAHGSSKPDGGSSPSARSAAIASPCDRRPKRVRHSAARQTG